MDMMDNMSDEQLASMVEMSSKMQGKSMPPHMQNMDPKVARHTPPV